MEQASVLLRQTPGWDGLSARKGYCSGHSGRLLLLPQGRGHLNDTPLRVLLDPIVRTKPAPILSEAHCAVHWALAPPRPLSAPPSERPRA